MPFQLRRLRVLLAGSGAAGFCGTLAKRFPRLYTGDREKGHAQQQSERKPAAACASFRGPTYNTQPGPLYDVGAASRVHLLRSQFKLKSTPKPVVSGDPWSLRCQCPCSTSASRAKTLGKAIIPIPKPQNQIAKLSRRASQPRISESKAWLQVKTSDDGQNAGRHLALKTI